MKVKMGPHQRRGRFRRRMKAVLIAVVLAALALVGGPVIPDFPEPEPALSPSEYQYMLNVSALSPGDAKVWAEQYPEHADEFLAAAGMR